MRVQDIKNEISSRSTGVIPRPRSISSLPPPVPSRSASRGQVSSGTESTMNHPRDLSDNDQSDNSVPDAATGSYERGQPKRMQSLDMQEKMTSSRRIKSSSFGSGDLIRTGKSHGQVPSNRRLLQRLHDSSNRAPREELSVQNQGDDFDASPSVQGDGAVPDSTNTTIRSPRRAQSLRGHRPLSSSHRTLSLNSCSSIEEQEVPRPPLPVRRKRRGVRRSQSTIVGSDAATTATAASESSKSSGSNNSSSSSSTTSSKGLKRCTSLDRRLDRRVRGDQAPITPLRGPPSPITSDDSSASPPQIENDFDLASLPPPLARMDKAFKLAPVPLTTPAGPVVSTSKIKRSATKQRSKRLLKSLSESKIEAKDNTNEMQTQDLPSTSHPTFLNSCPPTIEPTSSTETQTLPLAALGSPQTTTRLWNDIIEMSQVQKANRRQHSLRVKTIEKDAPKQRTFGFSRLARSFSSGGNLNIRRHFSATSSYPVKSPRKVVDDSTRSDTERTASTVSTSQSDFSSLHSLRDDCFSPSQPTASPSPSDPVVDLKSYSKLLSRLRTDFDLPPANEKDEYQPPRRPASMSSLMTHIAMDKMGTERGRGMEDDDDDSTIMSNIDAPPMRTARSRSSSGSRRRRRRATMTPSALSSSQSKVVNFGHVNVREYERCVGDNPAVSSGVPIGLGWQYSTYLDVDVDIYESSVRKPGPRTRKDFVLTPQDRFQILREECGYSPKEILQARELAAEVRYQRQVSVFGETGAQQQQLQTDSPPMYPTKRAPRGTYRRMRSTGSLQLPPLPLTDNRWGTSCPAAPSTESSQ